MRRPARHLFTLCSGVSLLLCVAACVLWVRSYFMVERIGRVHHTPGIDSENHHLYLQADWGVARLTGGGDPAENFSDVGWVWERWPASRLRHFGGDEPPLVRALGVAWERP